MTTIVTRIGKGSSLSWQEADANFTNLNTAKLEASALTPYLTIASASSTYALKTNPTTSGTFSHTGNLGIGVTPSAWTGSVYACEVNGVSIYGSQTTGVVGTNFYYDGTNYKVQNTGFSLAYRQQSDGAHVWQGTSSSNVAGNNVTLLELMRLTSTGALAFGGSSNVGTAGQVLQSNGPSASPTWTNVSSKQLQSITTSVASNALTVTYGGGTLDFRNATLSNGTPNSGVSIASNSITVPSGATLGTTSGQASQLALAEAYNAGSPVLCIANMAGLAINEAALISPTTISGSSNSAGVWYSASAVSANSPFRFVGYIQSTQATAGTWVTTPSLAQGAGGQVTAPFGSMVRLQTGNNNGSTNTAIRRFTTVVTNQGGDITYTDSATLGGSFTINTAGTYAISYVDNFSSAANFGLSLNSNQLTTAIGSITSANRLMINVAPSANQFGALSWTGCLSAGDVIRAHNSAGITNGTSPTDFCIARCS